MTAVASILYSAAQGLMTNLLRRLANRIALLTTRYVTDDRFELRRASHRFATETAPDTVEALVKRGIAQYFNRLPMYAALARDLTGTDLGDVVEFGELTRRSRGASRTGPGTSHPTIQKSTSRICTSTRRTASTPSCSTTSSSTCSGPNRRSPSARGSCVPVDASSQARRSWCRSTRHRTTTLAGRPPGCGYCSRRSSPMSTSSWGNREALQLLLQADAPHSWPTFDLAVKRWGETTTWRILTENEPAWPITVWAIAVKS